ncbi:MAG: Fic family protein [Sporomusaceae bacterium]|nr:Fic family protein [Sporomusaceae bacterium]
MAYELLSKIYYKENNIYEMIYRKRFESESTYQYDFMIGKYKAFLVIHLEVLQLVADIFKLDKKLQAISSELPRSALIQFTKKCIVDEVKLTNEIEGVYSTRKEIREIIDDRADNKKKRLYGLVNKYLMLIENQEIPLHSCRDIRNLYNEFILEEIKADDPKNVPDGEIFRKEIVEIVSPAQKVIHQGLYPEEKIISAMSAALQALHDDTMESMIRVAVFHYMFGYIHPFYDGNGRMTRFISSYLLAKNLEPVVAFAISYTIKEKIRKYYDLFKETNDQKNKGDLTPFVIGFLSFIKESVSNLCSTLEEKQEKLLFYSKKIEKKAKGNKHLGRVLFVLLQNSLFADEGITVAELVNILELSSSTVRAQLKQIPTDMLIVEQNGKMKLYDVNLDVLAEN